MEEKENLPGEDTLSDKDLDDENEEEKGEENSATAPKSETKKRQTKEENHYYAELRRKNEELAKKNKDLEKEVSEADFKARSKVISEHTLTELGLDSIEDANDLVLCEEYEKATKKGSENPVLDAQIAYRKKVKEREKEQKASIDKENENKRKVEEDKAVFKSKFGISTSEAIKDEDFMNMYGKFITYGNMSELYENYLKIRDKNSAGDEAKKKGVIPLSSSRTASSKKSINDLTGEDFLKAFKEKYN